MYLADEDSNVVAQPSNIGNPNPLKNRSYCYDNETRLYYLDNRYYDPKTYKFVDENNLLIANLVWMCKQ